MKKLFVLFTLVSSFLFIVTPAFAQIQAESLKESGCLAEGTNVATLNCIPVIIGNIVFFLLVFAGIVALVLIIISGFKFVTSGGEAKQAEGARKTLTFAIIGLVLILLSFAIVRLIADVTGVGCITRFGFEQCKYKQCTRAADCGSRNRCDPEAGFCRYGGGANQGEPIPE